MRKLLLTCILLTFLCSGSQASEKEDWKEFRSSHFIIYYKNAPRDMIETINETAEYYYQEITRNLGFYRHESWTWDKRAKIYIYRDSQDYVKTAKQMQWSHGAASAADKTIRTFPAAHGFFDSTLPHELGHIIFREFIGFNSFIPLWFDEGVAMYQEKARRWGSNQNVLKAMEEDRFIPLIELSYLKLYNQSENVVLCL